MKDLIGSDIDKTVDEDVSEPIITITDSLVNNKRASTWAECFAACDILKDFLTEKNLESEKMALERLTHRLRMRRVDTVTSQVSIRLFFTGKKDDA